MESGDGEKSMRTKNVNQTDFDRQDLVEEVGGLEQDSNNKSRSNNGNDDRTRNNDDDNDDDEDDDC